VRVKELEDEVARPRMENEFGKKLLSSPGMRYEDLGADYYERRRDIHRQISHHVGKLGALGFEVTLCRRPEPIQTRQGPPAPPDQYRNPKTQAGPHQPGSATACPAQVIFSGQ
jgi:hypothetical protein